MWFFACTMVELYNKDGVWNFKDHDDESFNCAVDNLTRKNIFNTYMVPIFLKRKLIKCFDYDPQLRPEIIEIMRLFKKELANK